MIIDVCVCVYIYIYIYIHMPGTNVPHESRPHQCEGALGILEPKRITNYNILVNYIYIYIYILYYAN